MDKSFNETLNGTSSKVNEFKRNAESQSRDYTSQLNKLSEDTGKKVGEMADQVRTMSEDYFRIGREYLRAGQRYVRINPEKSIAVALGIGVVIGGLVVTAFGRSRRQ